MKFRFTFTLEEEWPKLAWIAECVKSDSVIHVRHGSQVEARESWFCEAVWDGEFEAGRFDQTDLVFGSGGRLREEQVVFVSSGSTVDRLQFLELEYKVLISNSLPCLLAVSGIKVDHTYGRFQEFFQSIMKGIDSYEKRLPVLSGRLELTYFRNLVWDGRHLEEEDKPEFLRDFSSFSRYRGFLNASVAKIGDNMSAAARNHRYEMVGGLSSGYDSTTVAVVAHEAGMKQVFSFRAARGGQDDDGQVTAEHLGLDLTLFDRDGWRQQPFSEVPYFGAAALGGDTVLSAAQNSLRGRVFLSGFHGDKMWAKDTKAMGSNIVRGDVSGLGFTEHRLALGCIHFPVPFVGVRQIRDVHALSNSPELATWDVSGDYSRPICRRIVEEAGVPRECFGMSKKAITTHFGTGESMLSDETQAKSHRWLLGKRNQWVTTAAPRLGMPGRVLLAVRVRYDAVNRLLRKINYFLPGGARSWLDESDTQRQRCPYPRTSVVPHLFPWAAERMGDVYRSAKGSKEQCFGSASGTDQKRAS